jgi:hypothetical protein
MLFVFSTLTVIAQPGQRQRTKEFDRLNTFIGKWQTKGKVYPSEGVPPVEINGEPTFEWTMHKMWLMLKSGEGRLQGHGYITWSIELGKYVFFWFDNLLTKPTEYHGNWLDSKTLVFNGEFHFQGRMVYSRIKWQIISENEMNMVREVSTDGKKFRLSTELIYTKVH